MFGIQVVMQGVWHSYHLAYWLCFLFVCFVVGVFLSAAVLSLHAMMFLQYMCLAKGLGTGIQIYSS